MKHIGFILFFMSVLMSVSCSEENTLLSDRFVSVSLTMPGEGATTRVGVNLMENSKNLSVSFHADDAFSIYVRQGNVIQNVENVRFSLNGNDSKKGSLTFEMPESVDTDAAYTLYGVCGAHSYIEDGRLIINDNSMIKPSHDFQAPVWFEYTGKGTSLTVQCRYIGTFVVIHIDNKSATDNLFQIWGVISDALYDDIYWDENSRAFTEDFGVSPTSQAIAIAPGQKGVFIYNGVPNGKMMETINVSMHIGAEITWGMGIIAPEMPMHVGKMLEQGKAYHVYMTWDGENLRFGNVTHDILNGDVEAITVNGVPFKMVRVEAGSFMMGNENGDSDEKPVHKVSLNTYYIGQTEVTQELLEAVMGTNNSSFKGSNQLPADHLTWNDCQNFVKRLSELSPYPFRLPTEAEWEFAARGGNKSVGYSYSGSNNVDDVAWHGGNSKSSTHIVASKAPNELGLYDMSGNVWEWCQDWYGKYSSEAQSNPVGASSGKYRVLRGGGYASPKNNPRSTNRDDDPPSSKGLGLRLVIPVE